MALYRLYFKLSGGLADALLAKLTVFSQITQILEISKDGKTIPTTLGLQVVQSDKESEDPRSYATFHPLVPRHKANPVFIH